MPWHCITQIVFLVVYPEMKTKRTKTPGFVLPSFEVFFGHAVFATWLLGRCAFKDD